MKREDLIHLLEECLSQAEHFRHKPSHSGPCTGDVCDTDCQSSFYDSLFIEKIKEGIHSIKMGTIQD